MGYEHLRNIVKRRLNLGRGKDAVKATKQPLLAGLLLISEF